MMSLTCQHGVVQKYSSSGWRRKAIKVCMDVFQLISRLETNATILFLFVQDLKDYMRQAGEVTYADAHKPRRNEGCVEFASEKVKLSIIPYRFGLLTKICCSRT